MRRLTAFLIAALVCAAAPAIAGAQSPPTTADLQLENALMIAVAPSTGPVVVFVGDSRAHTAFELYITNFSKQTVRLTELNLSGGTYRKEIAGDALKASFVPLAGTHKTDAPPVLIAGQAGIFFLFLDFDSLDSTPASIEATVEAEIDGHPASLQRVATVHFTIRRTPTVIDSPLTGGNWLAGNGPLNTSVHRRAVIVLDGRARVPERYAIDFVQLGADGQTYSGEKHRNTSYHCYGLPIRAVADGRVVSVTDGITENVPNSGTLAPGLTIARLSGNDVVERIGPSTYAGYAHMIPGSLKVKPGDQVHAGQVLGLLGNSGNSTEPHLHFQLCDGPTFLECEGLPQEFRRFTLENYKTTTNADGTGKLSIGGRSEVTDQGLLENELVSFPAAH